MCLESDCDPDNPDCIVLQLTVSTGHRCSHVNTTLWSGLRLRIVVSDDFPIMEKTFRAKVRREGRP